MLAVHNASFLLETQSDKLSNSSKEALKTYSEDLKVIVVLGFYWGWHRIPYLSPLRPARFVFGKNCM